MSQPFVRNDISTELIATLPGAVYHLEYKGDEFRFLYTQRWYRTIVWCHTRTSSADISSISLLTHTDDFDRVIHENLTTAQHGVL